jgi:hypothetical protein
MINPLVTERRLSQDWMLSHTPGFVAGAGARLVSFGTSCIAATVLAATPAPERDRTAVPDCSLSIISLGEVAARA